MPAVTVNGEQYEVLASISDHDLYLVADITRAVSWAAESQDTKNKAAISVYRFFQTLRWIGEATGDDPWPRIIEGETVAIPDNVLNAAYILAADIAQTPSLLEDFAQARARGSITKLKPEPPK